MLPSWSLFARVICAASRAHNHQWCRAYGRTVSSALQQHPAEMNRLRVLSKQLAPYGEAGDALERSPAAGVPPVRIVIAPPYSRLMHTRGRCSNLCHGCVRQWRQGARDLERSVPAHAPRVQAERRVTVTCHADLAPRRARRPPCAVTPIDQTTRPHQRPAAPYNTYQSRAEPSHSALPPVRCAAPAARRPARPAPPPTPPPPPPQGYDRPPLVGSREEYEAMWRRSVEDPNGFWAEMASQFTWAKKVRPARACLLAVAAPARLLFPPQPACCFSPSLLPTQHAEHFPSPKLPSSMTARHSPRHLASPPRAPPRALHPSSSVGAAAPRVQL